MEITKREIIASITIIAIMLLLGVLISNKVSDLQMDENEKYNKAIQIQDTEMFKYGMSTSVGNAFVYGDLVAVDTVTFPEIGGEYIYAKKVREEYTRHTRTVSHTDGKGHTTTSIEVYYTWDEVSTERKQSVNVTFLEVPFKCSQFEIPWSDYIKTLDGGYHVRYKYYGTAPKMTGTIFSFLKDNNIGDHVDFYQDKDIAQTLDYVTSNFFVIVFWIAWVMLIVLAVVLFYQLDNKWLD